MIRQTRFLIYHLIDILRFWFPVQLNATNKWSRSVLSQYLITKIIKVQLPIQFEECTKQLPHPHKCYMDPDRGEHKFVRVIDSLFKYTILSISVGKAVGWSVITCTFCTIHITLSCRATRNSIGKLKKRTFSHNK